MTLINSIRRAAAGYEPVRARALATAALTLASGLGFVLGDLPSQVDAVLVFLTVAAPLVAGESARRKVTPVAALPVDPEPDFEDPALDLVR